MEQMREALLRDFVHCPVCDNLIQDAKQLSCLHTLCSSCINRMTGPNITGVTQFTGTRSRNISCPICRTETPITQIRTDFRTNDLVSRYQNPQLIPSEYPCTSCTIEVPRDIDWKCIDCDMLICDACKGTHARFPATQGHRIISVTEVARNAKEELSTMKERFTEANETLENQHNTVQYYKEYVIDQKLRMDSQIEATSRELISNFAEIVNVNAMGLGRKIANEEARENTLIEDLRSNIVRSKSSNQDAERQIEEILEIDDERKVAFKSHNGLLQCPQIHNGNFDMKEKLLFKSEDVLKPMVEAVLKNLLKVQIERTGFGQPNMTISPINKGRLCLDPFINQAGAQWTFKQKSTIRQNFQRLCIVGKNIWICIPSVHNISVMPFDGNRFIQQIMQEALKYPMAAAQTNTGTVMVACGENKGLIELSKDGDFIRHIETSGCYHDVSISGNNMAALEVSAGKVSIYQLTDQNWIKKYEVQPEINDPLNTILMHYELLVVGSIKGADENRVVIYERGKVLRRHTVLGDFVRVCCIDQYQSILVSQGRDHNLHILKATGDIEQLAVNNGLFYPLDVIFTDDCTIWVAQRAPEGTLLFKFMKN